MERIDVMQSAGEDASSLVDACTAEALHKKAIAAAKAVLTTTGLALVPEDSVWSSDHGAVRKLVAVGAAGNGSGRPLPTRVYVRSAEEFTRLFGNGSSGECGHRGTARAAVIELKALADRLLALVALDFRLRASPARACPLPIELRACLLYTSDAADE